MSVQLNLFPTQDGQTYSVIPKEIWGRIFLCLKPCHALGINRFLNELFRPGGTNHFFWQTQLEKNFPCSTLEKAEVPHKTYRINHELRKRYVSGISLIYNEIILHPFNIGGCKAVVPVLTYPDKNCAYVRENLTWLSFHVWNPKNETRYFFNLEKTSITNTPFYCDSISVERFKEAAVFYVFIGKDQQLEQIAIVSEGKCYGAIPIEKRIVKPILFNDRLYVAPSLKKLQAYDPLTGKELAEKPLLEIPEDVNSCILTYGVNRKTNHLHIMIGQNTFNDTATFFPANYFYVHSVNSLYEGNQIITFNAETREKLHAICHPLSFFTHATIYDNFLLVIKGNVISKWEITEGGLLPLWEYQYQAPFLKKKELFPHTIVCGNYLFCVSSLSDHNQQNAMDYLNIHDLVTGKVVSIFVLGPEVEQISVLEDCVCFYKSTRYGTKEVEVRDFGTNLLPNSEEIK